MKYTRFRHQIGTILVSLALIATAKSDMAEEPTPGYNTKIPESIITPDTVETRIGTLKFFDGIPTKETSALVYDNLDFLRGVESGADGPSDAEIDDLIARRMQAKRDKEWAAADAIRDRLKAAGILLEDTADGTSWRRA